MMFSKQPGYFRIEGRKKENFFFFLTLTIVVYNYLVLFIEILLIAIDVGFSTDSLRK